MTLEDYELLLDFECDEPNMTVIEFCKVGLTEKGKFNNYKDSFKQLTAAATKKLPQEEIHANPPEKEYSELRYVELRKMALDGRLHNEYMSESVYEYMLKKETDLDNDVSANSETHVFIVDFCTAGLKKYDKYKNLTDNEIFWCIKNRHIEIKEAEVEFLESFYKPKRRFFSPITVTRLIFKEPKLIARAIGEQFTLFYRKRKAVAVVGIAVICSTLLIGVSAALGFNFVDMIWNAISSPNRTATDSEGRGNTVLTDDVRIYNSMSEMLEIENLKILYPAKLPVEYKFADFVVFDSNGNFSVEALAIEPYISFIVQIGNEVLFDNYDYETNGIKYNIIERDGVYQAIWSDDTGYYTIAVSDKDVLLEIINNLQKSGKDSNQ
jgi:hypothetical protein